MNLETHNRKAFDLVTEAVEFIDMYRTSKDITRLSAATDRLAAANKMDPEYFCAIYYDAIVDDLAGRFKVAAEKLTRLLNVRSPMVEEVRYNLGLAEYHGYGHEALERAITQFHHVFASVKEPSLRLRALSSLAQAYAMHMIPKKHDEPDLKQISEYRALAFKAVSQTLRALFWNSLQRLIPFRKGSVDANVAHELRFTAYNAKGMALMYYSDYLPQIERVAGADGLKARIGCVKKALSCLARAESTMPDDWANRCDLASAHMRLGALAADPNQLNNALELLHDVHDRLRPGYGFARYEMGRVLRLMGNFDEAVKFFDSALQIPSDERDISDRRINIEIQRAEQQDRSFP